MFVLALYTLISSMWDLRTPWSWGMLRYSPRLPHYIMPNLGPSDVWICSSILNRAFVEPGALLCASDAGPLRLYRWVIAHMHHPDKSPRWLWSSSSDIATICDVCGCKMSVESQLGMIDVCWCSSHSRHVNHKLAAWPQVRGFGSLLCLRCSTTITLQFPSLVLSMADAVTPRSNNRDDVHH